MSTRIKVTIGRTINMSNYESERFDIGIERDADESELDDLYYDLNKIADTYEQEIRTKQRR